MLTLNNSLNPTQGSQLPTINGLITSVRVVDIILDNQHPQFEDYGEWNGIGTIMCEDVTINQFDKKDLTIATPLLPYLKNFPLVNEVVLLFSLPSRNMGSGGKKQEYYYLNPINLWNHPHHNAYPSSIKTSELPNQQHKKLSKYRSRIC